MTEHSRSTPQSIPSELLEEGAIWFARMRGPDADDFREEFEKWLHRGPLHPAAYERASEVFAMGRFLAAEHACQGRVANDNTIKRARVTWVSVAAALAIGLAFSAFIFLGRSQIGIIEPLVRSAALETGKAERYVASSGATLVVRLPDGSKVTLDPGSVLTRQFRTNRRELRLESGMARFEVAHEGRPFVVLAGGGSVTARGTIFDVRITTDRQVSVALVRGIIDVERPRATDGSITPFSRLEPGESLAFSAVSGALTLPSPHAGPGLSSTQFDREQPRVFDRTPLAAVLAEVQQVSGQTIRLSEPTIGQIRVSGRFRIDDSNLVADRLSVLFGLEVERSSTGELTLRQRD